MNVILLEKMGRLGSLGDQVNVKAGYGRNFLIPYGKAVPATKDNVASFELRPMSAAVIARGVRSILRTSSAETDCPGTGAPFCQLMWIASIAPRLT